MKRNDQIYVVDSLFQEKFKQHHKANPMKSPCCGHPDRKEAYKWYVINVYYLLMMEWRLPYSDHRKVFLWTTGKFSLRCHSKVLWNNPILVFYQNLDCAKGYIGNGQRNYTYRFRDGHEKDRIEADGRRRYSQQLILLLLLFLPLLPSKLISHSCHCHSTSLESRTTSPSKSINKKFKYF